VLTAGVDVQGDRLEVQVIAWGAGEESWACFYEVLQGDPAQASIWDELDALLLMSFRTQGGRTLRIRSASIDTGGHHAAMVHSFCRRRVSRRIYAIKGQAGPRPIWPKRGSKSKTKDTVFIVGVDTAKDAIYGRLRIQKPGPGFVHIPSADGFGPQYVEQLTSEKVVTRFKEGRPYRVWDLPKGKRNEALDTFVYALASLKSLPLRLDSKRAMEFANRKEAERRDPAPSVPAPTPPEAPTPPPPPPDFAGQKRRPARRVMRSNYMG
jgi:phage terminase large subunit GpA-like protein